MGFQRSVFYALGAMVLAGTTYSVLHGTFLDTSDPLLTHLPHPLGDSHYFASKKNWLNVYFIKKAWGWTSAVFLFTWLTGHSPSATNNRAANSRLLLTYLTLSAFWILFTSWFFGPALLERVVLASGGECILSGPSNVPVVVPQEYCLTKSTISPQSHPELFKAFLETTDGLTQAFVCPPSAPDCGIQNIRGVPRLRRGHDVSGHLFLLTMSILLLSEQVQVSLSSRPIQSWSTIHTFAVGVQGVLLVLWLLASATTSVYFHSPWEKLTGFLLGAAAYSAAYLMTSSIFPAGARSRRPAVRATTADKSQ